MRSFVLLPLENSRKIGLVGNPENRRVIDFCRTAKESGFENPDVVAWTDLIDEPEKSLSRLKCCGIVRIDSPGENAEVAMKLIRLGGGQINAAPQFGEVSWLEEQHAGFLQMLSRLELPDVRFMSAPGEIGSMFDKWNCHQIFSRTGLARPKTCLAARSLVEFQEQCLSLPESWNGRLFLKPRFGSSASGVCAIRFASDRQQLIGPIELDWSRGTYRIFNSLRIQSYTSLPEIEAILNGLLPQGMLMEQWIPKVCLPEGRIDLRVLVIAGEARHVVVRQSDHPMTNLHLGNRRGDYDQFISDLGGDVAEKGFRLAERAAACFPDSLYAGVDVLINSAFQPLIGEINAFGDLLPGLHHRGESPYEAILRACDAQHHHV